MFYELFLSNFCENCREDFLAEVAPDAIVYTGFIYALL